MTIKPTTAFAFDGTIVGGAIDQVFNLIGSSPYPAQKIAVYIEALNNQADAVVEVQMSDKVATGFVVAHTFTVAFGTTDWFVFDNVSAYMKLVSASDVVEIKVQATRQ